MKLRTLAFCSLIAALGPTSIAHGAPNDEPSLDWLEGCWQHKDGPTREIWDRGFDGLFFGHSVTVVDGELKFFEDIRIERRDGRLVYTVSPNGAQPVSFGAVTLTASPLSLGTVTEPASMVMFENADHDFPQRIHYVRVGIGLTATISDLEGSNEISFEMVSCAASK